MAKIANYELWFVTGSQHLYGPEVLKQVAADSTQIAKALDESAAIPAKVVFKPVLVSPESVSALVAEANNTPACIGLVMWCHTFSPSKMWINGLKELKKPAVHLHTQFNRDIPWGSIDMDFMNLNQAAHGDREHGFIWTRLRLNRKVVVGYWQEQAVQEKIGSFARAAAAWASWQGAKFARFGDNMREVAVTEGDKVSAQFKFGYSVNYHPVGDLVKVINAISDKEVDQLVAEYEAVYDVSSDLRSTGSRAKFVREQARIELGLRAFLKEGNFKGFTNTFEDLWGLEQLPGLAVQRLMADGYGFGAEGDWKTSALVQAVKVMATGLKGGTSFMEDYTYHLDPANKLVLGAHMLEVCPSIAAEKPKLEVHPLGIGGKMDPARLVFTTPAGPAVGASLIDLGNRFRLLVNDLEVVTPPHAMPKLPVAQAMWKPLPSLEESCACWIYAGGAHHTAFSQAVGSEVLEDFARIADIEFVSINAKTDVSEFQKELRFNEVYYAMNRGWTI
ncbi:L-arabinose isomerase [Rhizomicrobium palustre]|uniref:L-arabinose isomerase n=1 Tax=Rhizomicrobium palustre TaxID=189966 RepID=A0A846MXR5_9PROT|nr:L-arabinose isomerase [Rhizomicrobium palustre]NIK88384.1 L-arabinose isomerase [Rhizomicrobium palustre]